MVYTVDMVNTVDMIYTLDMLYIVDMVMEVAPGYTLFTLLKWFTLLDVTDGSYPLDCYDCYK